MSSYSIKYQLNVRVQYYLTIKWNQSIYTILLLLTIRRLSKHLCRHHCNIPASAVASSIRRTWPDP